jgi:hypothetical protein
VLPTRSGDGDGTRHFHTSSNMLHNLQHSFAHYVLHYRQRTTRYKLYTTHYTTFTHHTLGDGDGGAVTIRLGVPGPAVNGRDALMKVCACMCVCVCEIVCVCVCECVCVRLCL